MIDAKIEQAFEKWLRGEGHPFSGPVVNLSKQDAALLAFAAGYAEGQKEIAGLRAFKRSVDEALNSGDGVYRP